MKLGLVTLAAFVALGAATPAHASTPMPWCGTASSGVDRFPDVTPGFAVHVAYVRSPGTPDRFSELAPRIVGDVAAFDAWWRREDPARMPRFDLFPAPGCATAFGALDITNVAVTQDVVDIDAGFQQLRQELASKAGFSEPEKAYLVYYDGPTNQVGEDVVCGQGSRGLGTSLPGLAIVYLDACELDIDDVARPVVAVHELLHVFGAVSSTAPSACRSGHVCDFPLDLMTARVTGEELDAHTLDFGRNDYYGHTGSWTDVQDSLFLERLDGPDRSAPTAPAALVVKADAGGAVVTFSWRPSSDDVGPVTYWVYQDGRFRQDVLRTSALLVPPNNNAVSYTVRAVDAVGHLSQPATVRFKPGLGVVDVQGRLLRDTVPPPAIRPVSIRRTTKTVVISWPTARDPGGLRNYRVKVGTRTFFVTKPTVTIRRGTLRTAVSVAAVDRAGNIGPTTTVPRRRLR